MGVFFFFQVVDGIRERHVTGVQTCALPISDGDEYGVWRRQPFDSPTQTRTQQPISLPAAYDAGLLLAADGTAVIGRSDESYGTQIHAVYVGPVSAGTDPRLRSEERRGGEGGRWRGGT